MEVAKLTTKQLQYPATAHAVLSSERAMMVHLVALLPPQLAPLFVGDVPDLTTPTLHILAAELTTSPPQFLAVLLATLK